MDLEDLKNKFSDISSNSDKKLKSFNETITELKAKYTTFYGEFRKDIRDNNNKFEKIKNETDNKIEASSEDLKVILENNQNSFNKKIQSIAEDLHLKSVENSKNFKNFEEKFEG